MSTALSRRSALRGGAVVVLGAVIGFVVARRSDAAKAAEPGAAANGFGPVADAEGRAALAPLTDVPDGGGVVLGHEHVVLTRDGEAVHGFSSTCTHQGCTVSGVSDGEIRCPCHSSVFDATTGKVVSGPATRALPPVAVEVRDGTVYRAQGG